MRKSPLLVANHPGVAAIGTPSFGASFTFNFNSLTGYSSSTGNQETSIANQLQQQLQTVCPTCTVTATSGTVAAIDKTYTGEGFAVGPTNGLTGSSGRVVCGTHGDPPGPNAAVLTRTYLATLYIKQFAIHVQPANHPGFFQPIPCQHE